MQHPFLNKKKVEKKDSLFHKFKLEKTNFQRESGELCQTAYFVITIIIVPINVSPLLSTSIPDRVSVVSKLKRRHHLIQLKAYWIYLSVSNANSWISTSNSSNYLNLAHQTLSSKSHFFHPWDPDRVWEPKVSFKSTYCFKNPFIFFNPS